MDRLEGRMDRLEGRMDRLERKVDALDQQVKGLQGTLDDILVAVQQLSEGQKPVVPPRAPRHGAGHSHE